MRWSDVIGGLLAMLATMIAVIILALPIFEGRHTFSFLAMVLPLAVLGGGFVVGGRYWQLPVLSNRKSSRTACQLPAEIIVSTKQPHIRCTVVDISERGARLSVPAGHTAAIPTRFELVIDGDPKRRTCMVSWIQHDTLGVEFQM